MAEKIKEMSFIDHLEELRKRVIRCLLVVTLFSTVCYIFSRHIIDFIVKPLHTDVYFMSPTEGFMVGIKVSIIAGVILSIPVIIYQLWRFIAPGLFGKEIKIAFPIIVTSTLSFFAGGSFCFFLVVPRAAKFLLGFGTDKLHPLIRITDYISFVGYMTLAFGASFELPIVAYFLAKMGVLGPGIMTKGRRYAIVGILIVAGVVTPTPDAFTQLTLAVPLYLLYEISIIIVKIVHKGKLKKENEG
jgi:sec-independent protein translocase protein TatC